MLAKDIISTLAAKPLNIWKQDLLDKDYAYCFASDLMSDCLAMISNNENATVLLTGLCNVQSLRTAEMLDLELIIYVRGKKLDDEVLNMAKSMNCNIFTTDYTLFEACGKLYQQGLASIDVE
ncbi:MAG: hypothetical protein MR210_04175 [Erysipelotrichaceae bacterium]|nr:hypothetical protein [Erysipelotrichaceae bacterium]